MLHGLQEGNISRDFCPVGSSYIPKGNYIISECEYSTRPMDAEVQQPSYSHTGKYCIGMTNSTLFVISKLEYIVCFISPINLKDYAARCKHQQAASMTTSLPHDSDYLTHLIMLINVVFYRNSMWLTR